MGKFVSVINAPRRQGDPASMANCSEKAKKKIGWSPTIPELDKIIQSAWYWELKRQRLKYEH
jgi:UDP-glucose 4-epimerase